MNTLRNPGSNRQQILRIREQILLVNPDAFSGNSGARKSYLQQLQSIKPDLTPFQKEYLIGLLLSDASVDLDPIKGTARIKIQQSVEHIVWLKNIKRIFLEYMGNDKELSNTSPTRAGMVELQTLKCKVFYDFLNPIFYKGQTLKTIDAKLIEPHIGAVCVAAWFCGDGSKADFTPNEGKGITFHSQGFSQTENENLAALLKSKLDLTCQAKLDGQKSQQWRIDMSGESYETFVTKVGPYIDKTFESRVPSGREVNSRFGYMTASKRDALLGSAIQNLDGIVETYI